MQTEQQSLRAAAGQRFWQIDALRGLALLNMLVYHAMYDWVYIFGHASGWYDIWSTHCHVWQQYICWSFILLSGYSFTLSRRPLKNGLLTAACAVVLTVATAVAMPEEVIWFGVLHLLGCAALLTCLLHPALEKLPPLAGVTGSAVLFALLNQLPQGWLGFEGTHLAALPAAWYKPNLFWLGLPDLTVFSSSDYFPLLPWVFLVLFCAVVPRPLHRAARPAAKSPAPPVRRGQPHAADLYAAPAGNLRRFIGLAVLGFCINYCPYPVYEGKKLNFL